MGLACVKPRVKEWDEPQTAKQVAWGIESSPSKALRPTGALSEPNSPGLIRAHHVDSGKEVSPSRRGREAVNCPTEELPPQPEEQISWCCGECIGQGAFGKVFLGLNTVSGKLMAVKQIRISNEQAVAGPVAEHVRKVEAEVHLLKQLHHPNIVQYLGTERTNEHLNIFLEYVPGGSIASLLTKFGRFNESIIKIYTRQILLGLNYLHEHVIMHRDIKGANILVDNTGLVKLADFGASKKIESLATIDSGMKQSIKGTPHWMAPEVIYQKGVGRAADIWSVACTVIEMATGKPPWSNFTSQVSVMLHIAQTNGPPPIPESLSNAGQDFLQLCFNRSPRDRPNAKRLLQHPFLQGAFTREATASPLTNISQLPLLPRGLTQMEVPSPVHEESGTTGTTATPTSRGTGATSTSSGNRRGQEQTDEDLLSRFSPMGAAVRQSQLVGLAPVMEGSLEGQRHSTDAGAVGLSVGDSNAFVAPQDNDLAGSLRLRTSIDEYNPVVEPTWNAEQSPWRGLAKEEDRDQEVTASRKQSWPRMSLAASDRNQPGAQVLLLEEEADEDCIMQWVQDRAHKETMRLSQSFQSFSLRQTHVRPSKIKGGSPSKLCSPSGVRSPHSPPGAGQMWRQQWEAELHQELEQHRQEQRLAQPTGRRLDGSPSKQQAAIHT